MIPIRDDNPTRTVPWATIALIAANVAVFVYTLTLPPAQLQSVWTSWSIVPARLLDGLLDPREIATVFTSMFMHAGWVHLTGNLLYLWIFGNNVEDRLGPLRFTIFYLLSGIGAAAAQVVMDPGRQYTDARR